MRASKKSTSTEVRCCSPAGSTMPCPTSMDATWANPACVSLDSWLGGGGTPPFGLFQPASQLAKCQFPTNFQLSPGILSTVLSLLMPCPTSIDAMWANPACASLNTWLGREGMPPAAAPLGSFQPTMQPTKM